MSTPQCKLILLVNNITSCLDFTEKDWEHVVRQARASQLLYKVYCLLKNSDLIEQVPASAKKHLLSVVVTGDSFRDGVVREISHIREAFRGISQPVVLLKGAAYVAMGLKASQGRIFSDIDILVPKNNLASVEKTIRFHGWFIGAIESYDEEYYRKWMHELPPMQHIKRHTTLDIHHAILPPTANLKPNSEKILNDIQPTDSQGVYALSPVDMVLHSATHLFQDGEFDHGLRDLIDLSELLNYFGENDSEFWQKLIPRAEQLDLLVPLYYCLRYVVRILHTPVPESTLGELMGKVSVNDTVADFLFARALMPNHVSCDDKWTGLARWMLYIRSHYLRMPLYLLIPHLIRKTYKSYQAPTKKTP